MDEFHGYEYSFSGFVDYGACYHEVGSLWQAIGWVIFFGTVVSIIPQIISLVKNRTSYGLNPLTVFLTSWGQFVLALNYVCLHSADFVGIFQYSFTRWIPRLSTFINLFILWFLYSVIPFGIYIFADMAVRPKISLQKCEQNFKIYTVVGIVTSSANIISLIVSWSIGGSIGFHSRAFSNIGQVFGDISTFIVFLQYAPQMITTCKLRDNGSLSLIFLSIQAPGGLINSMFMCFGNHDHWTTWISIFLASVQQVILLTICIFFKCRKSVKNSKNAELMTEKSMTSQSGPDSSSLSGCQAPLLQRQS